MHQKDKTTQPLEELKNGKHRKGIFERFSSTATQAVGSSAAFLIAFCFVLLWAVSGPIFGFSESWQLVVNTGTTIITFLMVFLIQKSQNKDSKAIQLKLNELIACNKYASNRLISLEDLTEEELDLIHRFYHELSLRAAKSTSLHETHSLDEAEERHQSKMRKRENNANG